MSVPKSRCYDVIVIGGGAMGSAACYYLAKQGKKVLVLERFTIAHDKGSSHGDTRIFRFAYSEGTEYVKLMEAADAEVQAMETLTGKQLRVVTGSIDAGPENSWAFEGALKSAIENNMEYRVFTSTQLHQEAYQGYHLPLGYKALWEPRGGFYLPEEFIKTYAGVAAARHGAEIHSCEPVIGWQPSGDGVKVTTEYATYYADKLVVTAGAWNGELADPLKDLLTPERQILLWMQPRQPELFQPGNFPVGNLLVGGDRGYVFPMTGIDGLIEGVKLGIYHSPGQKGCADTLNWPAQPQEIKVLRDFAARCFPEDAFGENLHTAVCKFTNAPESHFIVDFLTENEKDKRVMGVAGGSGHMFKFAAIFGKIMADLAIHGETEHDIRLLSLAKAKARAAAAKAV